MRRYTSSPNNLPNNGQQVICVAPLKSLVPIIYSEALLSSTWMWHCSEIEFRAVLFRCSGKSEADAIKAQIWTSWSLNVFCGQLCIHACQKSSQIQERLAKRQSTQKHKSLIRVDLQLEEITHYPKQSGTHFTYNKHDHTNIQKKTKQNNERVNVEKTHFRLFGSHS